MNDFPKQNKVLAPGENSSLIVTFSRLWTSFCYCHCHFLCEWHRNGRHAAYCHSFNPSSSPLPHHRRTTPHQHIVYQPKDHHIIAEIIFAVAGRISKNLHQHRTFPSTYNTTASRSSAEIDIHDGFKTYPLPHAVSLGGLRAGRHSTHVLWPSYWVQCS